MIYELKSHTDRLRMDFESQIIPPYWAGEIATWNELGKDDYEKYKAAEKLLEIYL